MKARSSSAAWRLTAAALAVSIPVGLARSAAAQAVGGGPACGSEQQIIVPANLGPSSEFGRSVSLDADTALVGASLIAFNRGSAFVFARGPGGWVEERELVASNGASGDRLGWSTRIEGDTAITGAPRKDGVAFETGAVYVFERSGGLWVETAELSAIDAAERNWFGVSVDSDSGRAAIGAPGRFPVGGAVPGKAYVFVRSGAQWNQEVRLVSPDTAPEDGFGFSVALDGDTLVVGAPGTANRRGAAYVYRRGASGWMLEASLLDSPPAPQAEFGHSVAIDGDTLVVGAPHRPVEYGSASVFVRAGSSWQFQQKLLVEDPVPAGLPRQLGRSVAVEGDLALVGGPGDSNTGAAYLFVRSGERWARWDDVHASNGSAGAGLGGACALNGTTALVGAFRQGNPTIDMGSAYDFAAPPAVGTSFCSCPAGPCGNSDAQAGCANSSGPGATLVARGTTLPDEVALLAFDAPPGELGHFVQGDDAVTLPFGDGFLCTRANLLRLWTAPMQIPPSGRIHYSKCFGDLPISQVTGVVPGSGDIRRYQFWFRDRTGPCATGFGLSNALEIVW